MPEKYYYHITNKKNLESILHYGLIPQIGPNSEFMGEEHSMVYLCGQKDIAIWSILLDDVDIVLKINNKNLSQLFDINKYDTYYEYMYHDPIDPKYIHVAKMPSKHEKQKAMHDLAISNLYLLSHLCFDALTIERRILNNKNNRQMTSHENAASYHAETITRQLKILEKIDFTSCTVREMAKVIRRHSNYMCYVTFSDYYYDKNFNPDIPDAGKRCWEHLKNIDVPILREPCRQLYGFIKSNIPYYVRKLNNIGSFCM